VVNCTLGFERAEGQLSQSRKKTVNKCEYLASVRQVDRKHRAMTNRLQTDVPKGDSRVVVSKESSTNDLLSEYDRLCQKLRNHNRETAARGEIQLECGDGNNAGGIDTDKQDSRQQGQSCRSAMDILLELFEEQAKINRRTFRQLKALKTEITSSCERACDGKQTAK
jgi:hypothetical protein